MFAATGSGHVHRSTDGGATWHDSSDGLPRGQYLPAVAVAPTDSALVYAGT